MNTQRLVFAALMLSGLVSSAYAAEPSAIAGNLEITPAALGNCIAVEITPSSGESLDAIEWYRSGTLTSAHLYRAASVHEIDLGNPLVSLGNVSENLDVWETRPLANPLGGGMPIYLVFQMSAAQGAGLAYVDEPNGLPIYASAGDGDWYRVASSLSPAVRPHLSSTIFGGGSTGTMNRSVAEPPAQADRVATALLDPTPNPSNPSTQIRFSLAETAEVFLSIYNVRGELIWDVSPQEYSPGPHTVIWRGLDLRGSSVASGVYFVRMITAGYEASRRLTLVR